MVIKISRNADARARQHEVIRAIKALPAGTRVIAFAWNDDGPFDAFELIGSVDADQPWIGRCRLMLAVTERRMTEQAS